MVRYRDLQNGAILWQKSNGTSFPIIKIPDEPSNVKCSECGYAVWNGHNLSNTVHVCPTKILDSADVGKHMVTIERDVNWRKTLK